MKITHNDDEITVKDEINIEQFLSLRDVKHPKYAVVELNGEIIDQKLWSTTILKEGDDIEHAYLSGGG